MLSAISKLLSSLLVPILFAGIVILTLSQTLFNPKYLEGQLSSTHAYSRLADSVNDQYASDAAQSGASKEQVRAQLQTIITPTVVQQKVNSVLDQSQAYYKSDGTMQVATVDFNDVFAQMQAAGVASQTDNAPKPLQLTVFKQAKDLKDKLQPVGFIVIAGTIILMLSVLAIAIARRNFKPIANIFTVLGTMTIVFGIVMYLVPTLIQNVAHLKTSSTSFAGIGRDLITALTHSIGLRFVITGVILLAIGIISRVILGMLARAKGSLAPAAAPIAARQPLQPAYNSMPGPVASADMANQANSPIEQTIDTPVESPVQPAPASPLPQNPTSTIPQQPRSRKIQL